MKNMRSWRWVLVLGTIVVLATAGALASTLAIARTTAAATEASLPTGGEPQDKLPDMVAAVTALENQFVAVYERSSPSVVNITNRRIVMSRFMGSTPQEGTGSGFVSDGQGHIVTNYHVIEDADQLMVTLANGSVYEASVVGSDPLNDLAVIRIDAGKDLPQPLLLGDSDQLRVGQFVLAIGNPFGVGQTLTTGVISALGRIIESPEEDGFIAEVIQTDAAINPGNSGGPMLDLRGRVIGVNSQIVSPSGGSAGIGFAVSSATVRQVVLELIEKGYVAHPWLGADMLALTPGVSDLLREAGADIPVDRGLLVLQTDANGPADKSGIRGRDTRLRLGRYQLPVGGDIIVEINGVPVVSMQDLSIYLQTETTVGDTIQITVVRDDTEATLQLTLEAQPQPGSIGG